MTSFDPQTGVEFHDALDTISPIHTYVNDPIATINVYLKKFAGGAAFFGPWADATARGVQTGMILGSKGYQTDVDTVFRYNGSTWIAWEKPWSTFTPAYSGTTSTAPTSTGKYKIGESEVSCRVDYTWGTTPSISGGIQLTLPVPMVTTGMNLNTSVLAGTVAFDNGSTTAYTGGIVRVIDANTVSLLRNSAANPGVEATTAAALPFTPVAGNKFSAHFLYPIG